MQPDVDAKLVSRLRAAGCVFAEDEAALLVEAATSAAELDRLVGEIAASGGRAAAVAGDVRDEAVAKDAVAAAIERFGGLDIAVNNAGASAEPVPTHPTGPPAPGSVEAMSAASPSTTATG